MKCALADIESTVWLGAAPEVTDLHSESSPCVKWPLPSPKVRSADRLGVHRWLYYYAAFSARFVKSILTSARLDSESLVLDPFVGCGTTSVVAKSVGIPSIGVDLNPTAYYVSRAKVAWNPDLKELKRALTGLRKRVPEVAATTDYAKWFCRNDRAPIQTLGLGQAIVERIETDDLRDFLMAALLMSLRRVARVRRSTNPTWLRKRASPSMTDPYLAFKEQANSMFEDLSEMQANRQTKAEIFFADSTKLQLQRSCDVIITSPPYLTRIDYVISFRLENEFLANLRLPNAFRISELRDAMVGTVTISDKELVRKEPDPMWGHTCVNILEKVRHHPTKASLSYYYPTIYLYFERTRKWLQCCLDLLQKGGQLFVVVQTSYFKDFEIPVGRILLEMGKNLGYRSQQKIRTETVHTHMGLLSPEQRKRAPNKVLHEDVLLLDK